ncbi:thymidylate synthase [Candidatus Dojkabacteria bacterium]|jgi:thymidylate synthase|nr:thymidylate synthase [Candidatus Dojkabacteria bacterium]
MKNPNYTVREYDQALSQILNHGFDIDGDRTGVGTRCKFGLSTQYDISKRVPVLTKRKVFWKSIVKEVLWYVSGSHNINDLEATGSNIWTPWKNKEFADKYGFPEGSGGYIYGFNLIHYGANLGLVDASQKYGTYEEHPDWHGFNQLNYVINTLKANPKSRQACFTFWRPDTNTMAILPACHAFYSFIVSPDVNGELTVLNCHLFQRSNDFPVGVGYGNLWIATLFTHMIAQQIGMTPGMLYHSGSHCHIYLNAIEATKEYISREEEPNSPILHLNHKSSIYDYTIDDFELEDYNPLPVIKFPIAV